jgi:tRNA threonylcarbamoyl adenosine modification protein (Sua5/YciO/YrdC/YwlC family)
MAIRLDVHPTHPQARLISQAGELLRAGGLLAYPTDSGYALGWHLDSREAQERVVRLRGLDFKHNFTVVCRTLSEIGTYARMHDAAFRLIRSLTPGPYTFVLPATVQLPRRLQQAKKRSVGVRIPDHAVALALVEKLGEPLFSSSLVLPGEDMSGWEVDDLYEHVQRDVDIFLDSGFCGNEPTTVIDLLGDHPQIARQGKGIPPAL